MANIKSAEKRNRQRIKRRLRNQARKSRVRTYMKKVREALATSKEQAPEALRAAIREIDKAAQKGVLKRTTASRQISRLTRAVNRATAQ